MPGERPRSVPLVALVEKAGRAMRADMVRHAHAVGFSELQPAHNAVFATLPPEGARSVDMATRAGITRQSMGEVLRDMAARDLVAMTPDPDDGRAKVVRLTEHGRDIARAGYDRIREVDRLLRQEYGDDAVDTARRVLAAVPEMLEELP